MNGGTHRPSHSRKGQVSLNAMGQLRVEMHRVEDRGAERSTDRLCLVRVQVVPQRGNQELSYSVRPRKRVLGD